MIKAKRMELLKKLRRTTKKGLTNDRASELAGIMDRMLEHSEKDYLTQEHIPMRDFTLSNELVQLFANSQVRTGEDFYQKNNPA